MVGTAGIAAKIRAKAMGPTLTVDMNLMLARILPVANATRL